MAEAQILPDARFSDTVTATPTTTCISTPDELEPLLRNLTFYADVEQQRKRGLDRTHLWQLVSRNTGKDEVR